MKFTLQEVKNNLNKDLYQIFLNYRIGNRKQWKKQHKKVIGELKYSFKLFEDHLHHYLLRKGVNETNIAVDSGKIGILHQCLRYSRCRFRIHFNMKPNTIVNRNFFTDFYPIFTTDYYYLNKQKKICIEVITQAEMEKILEKMRQEREEKKRIAGNKYIQHDEGSPHRIVPFYQTINYGVKVPILKL
jgi:hypothetical protein